MGAKTRCQAAGHRLYGEHGVSDIENYEAYDVALTPTRPPDPQEIIESAVRMGMDRSEATRIVMRALNRCDRVTPAMSE